MPGPGQSRTPLAAPYLELPGQQRIVVGLTVNLVMQGPQLSGVLSRLLPVQQLERYAYRGHGGAARGQVMIRNGPGR